MSTATVNVLDFASAKSSTSGIQEAIDALPESGGLVVLPAGVYPLRRSVLLRSRVHVQGAGAATVLTRPAEFSSPLAQDVAANETKAILQSLGDIRIGDELAIHDKEEGGWHMRHGIVRKIQERTVELELLPASKPELAYLCSRQAAATNRFPAFFINEAHEVTISQLTIDGEIKQHPAPTSDFTCAAVHGRRANDLRVLWVTVRNWPADGIGVQSGEGALVSGCIVENCRGPGFHPGTSMANSVWSDNIGRNNTGDGLYFCLNVANSVFHGNRFYRNGKNGIGGLGFPDRCNTVTGNTCSENAEHGIEAYRAFGNTIQGNVLRNNSMKTPGQFAGICLKEHRGNIVKNNVCIDDQEQPTQTQGVVSVEPTGENIIDDNLTVIGSPQKK